VKNLFFIVGFLLLSGQLFAQASTAANAGSTSIVLPTPLAIREISGVVRNIMEQPVSCVKLVLTSKSDTLSVMTNADGEFIFRNVKQYSFTLQITNDEYKPQVIQYRMNSVKPNILLETIKLKQELKVRDITAVIKGYMDQRLPGVNVFLTSKTDTLSAVTDANGEFTFHNVVQTLFALTITKKGYEHDIIPHLEVNNDIKTVVLNPIMLQKISR